MNSTNTDSWTTFVHEFTDLREVVGKTKTIDITTDGLKERAKSLVQRYFREARPQLTTLNCSQEVLAQLDSYLQQLLRLAHGKNRKKSYQRVLKEIRQTTHSINNETEIAYGREQSKRHANSLVFSKLETALLETLKELTPLAALSYEQAIKDLAEPSRLSYRGTATELRETLREVLDRLAPDKEVEKSPGFNFEPDQTKPTQKQKVRFILKSRGLSKSAMKVPETSVTLAEELTGTLARSLYDRGSISVHTGALRAEVRKLKLYIDGVLAELLEVHERA